MNQQHPEPSQIHGIRYFIPNEPFRISGREGKVDIPWSGIPVPLAEDDYQSAVESGAPGYDQLGRGLFQALRTNPDCNYANEYASVLKEGYPHIISEIGGEAIMLDAKEVDTPYLDRKINMLKIMALMDPENAGLCREIGRTLMEKGSRLDALHMAVGAWYGAEKYLTRAASLDPEDSYTSYQLGETHYVLGHYQTAAEIWQGLGVALKEDEANLIESRLSAIESGKLPKVPPVDYLTALSVAIEHRGHDTYETVAIIEDVLADDLFCSQFPMASIYNYLADCYTELNLPDKANVIRGRC